MRLKKNGQRTKIKMKSLSELYENKTRLDEAESIEFEQLSPEDQKIAGKLVKAFDKKTSDIVDVFDGIHGKIIMIPYSNFSGNNRYDSDNIKALSKIKEFRWVEDSATYISIAF